MAGTKFGTNSPKKIKFVMEKTQTDFGFKTLTRVDSGLLETQN
jgi:hypothetical protein